MAYKILNILLPSLPVDIINNILEYTGSKYMTSIYHLHKIYNVLKIKYMWLCAENLEDIFSKNNKIKNYNYARLRLCRKFFSWYDIPRLRNIIKVEVYDNYWFITNDYISLYVINCYSCSRYTGQFCSYCDFSNCKDNEIFLHKTKHL